MRVLVCVVFVIVLRGGFSMPMFTDLVIWGLAFMIYVFAAPILIDSIGLSVTSGPVGFVVYLFPIAILLFLVNNVYRLVVWGGR